MSPGVHLSSVPVSFPISQRGTGPQGLKSQGREWPRDPWDPAWGAGPPSWGSPWCQDMGAGGFLGLPGDAVPFQVHVKLRPHVQQFLESLSKTYEVPAPPCSPGVCGELSGCCCIGGGCGQPAQGPSPAPPDLHLHNGEAGLRREGPGCAGPPEEADQVMALVEPRWGPPVWQGWVPTGAASPSRRCLSQQDCLCARGCYWKDLTRLGRDLAKTVALDHTIQGFPAQVRQRWLSGASSLGALGARRQRQLLRGQRSPSLPRLPTGSRCRGGGGTHGTRSCCASPRCWDSSAAR